MAFIDADAWLLLNHPHLFSNHYSVMPGQAQLIEPINTDLVIGSNWAGSYEENFTTSVAGLVTFTGEDAVFFYAPSLQFRASKACTLLFKTKVNGITVSSTEFDIIATTVGTSRVVFRMALIPLVKNDTVQIFVQSDTANVTLTWQQASILLKG